MERSLSGFSFSPEDLSMSNNPYAPGQVELAQPSANEGAVVYASQNKRFLNLILDTVFFYLGAIACGVCLGLAVVFELLQEETFDALAGFVMFPIYLGHYIVFEFCFGKTFGKLITGTRVIRSDGGKPSFGQVLGRTACRFIPFEAFSFLFGDNTTGWHDSFSGTRLIDERRKARQGLADRSLAR